MRATITWSEPALAELDAACDALARNAPRYARTLAERVVHAAERLALFPLSGAEVTEYAGSGVREIYEHPFRLLYRVPTPDRVEILSVIHFARRLPIHPPMANGRP